MIEFVPLHVHSHYSLLDGLSKPTQIAERAVECGYKACALTDHGSISGSIQLIKACADVCTCSHQKNTHSPQCKHKGCACQGFQPANLKPILGSELYLCPKDAKIKEKDNRRLSHLVVLAKNLEGWKQLIQLTSACNHPDRVWYKKPRLDLDNLAKFTGNLISFSGHMGSDLANICFSEPRLAYKVTTYEDAKALVRTDWKDAVLKLAGKYQDIFGKENFYLEIQLIDHINLPASEIVAKILRWASKKLNIPCVATCDAHYPRKQDAQDQRIELCSQLKTTLSVIERKMEYEEDITLGSFFKSNNYHIPSLEEMVALHEEEELNNSVKIAEQCESYNILTKKMLLPDFDCPDNLSGDDYLRKLCIKGWNSKIRPMGNTHKKDYEDRIKYELKTILEAGLSGYFLIVQDYMNWARNQGWLLGPGRGSGAGCLISYLTGITSIDPLEYGLLFERFYNAGRNTKDRVSIPDIDCDFPREKREDVIAYINNKYGHDKVAQMITFGRMQGKSSLTDVMRAHEACSFDEIKKICKFIPNDAEISDDLEEMRKEFGESSIIKWALENNQKELKEWCYINDNGELEGEYAIRFEQAIRMEGVKRSIGKHASGIVIAPQPLAEICPMVYDSNENKVIAGFEMNDLEAIGIPKFDILGVNVLDKIMDVSNILSKRAI